MMEAKSEDQDVSFRLLHIGVNCASAQEASALTDLYAAMLGKSASEGATSHFVGSEIEVMKSPFLGTHGHMAYGVSNMDRALTFLADKGFFPAMDTAVYNEEGKMIVIYLQGEFGGFAVHLKLI